MVSRSAESLWLISGCEICIRSAIMTLRMKLFSSSVDRPASRSFCRESCAVS